MTYYSTDRKTIFIDVGSTTSFLPIWLILESYTGMTSMTIIISWNQREIEIFWDETSVLYYDGVQLDNRYSWRRNINKISHSGFRN